MLAFDDSCDHSARHDGEEAGVMGNGLTSAEGEKGNRNTSSKFQTEPISGQKFVLPDPIFGLR